MRTDPAWTITRSGGDPPLGEDVILLAACRTTSATSTVRTRRLFAVGQRRPLVRGCSGRVPARQSQGPDGQLVGAARVHVTPGSRRRSRPASAARRMALRRLRWSRASSTGSSDGQLLDQHVCTRGACGPSIRIDRDPADLWTMAQACGRAVTGDRPAAQWLPKGRHTARTLLNPRLIRDHPRVETTLKPSGSRVPAGQRPRARAGARSRRAAASEASSSVRDHNGAPKAGARTERVGDVQDRAPPARMRVGRYGGQPHADRRSCVTSGSSSRSSSGSTPVDDRHRCSARVVSRRVPGGPSSCDHRGGIDPPMASR